MKRSVNFGGSKGKKGRYARSVAGFVDLAKWVGMSDDKIIETVDRRRHPREMTVESLDRDIMLMKEMVVILLRNPGVTEFDKWNSMQEIDHNMLFVLLILTGSIWFWLIVIARRRLALLAEHDRGRS